MCDQVEEMHTTLAAWSPLKPTAALELLDAKFADMHIRNYAVSRLASILQLKGPTLVWRCVY